MKKHITLLSGLLLVTGLNAQVSNLNYPQRPNKLSTDKATSVSTPTPAPSKALGTTFWTDDFSTTSNWTVDNSGQSGATFGWSIDNTVDGWWAPSTGIASTSEGNFAELSNGDPTASPATQALNVTYNLTTTNPIALTNGTSVTLEFLQYGARFNDLQQIQISTDSSIWTAVGDNSDFDVLSQSGGSAYPNPSTKMINLTSYLSGATQVWIRFSWTTNYPSQATNANVWVAYGWFIDDVKLSTNADYDLALTDEYWGTAGLGYYQIPTTQVAPIDFSINVLNQGVSPMTNVAYSVDINSGAFTGTSATTASIAPLSTDSLYLTTQFTPSAVGAYAVTQTLSSTETDDIASNNQLDSFTFNVTDYIYARDNGTANGYTGNGTEGYEVGNLFDIWQDQDIKGVNVRMATGTPVGTEVYASIYSIQNGDFVLELQSDLYAVASSDLNNSNYTIYLGTPFTLLANNTYLVMVGSYGSTFRVANAGTSDAQTSFFLDGNDIASSTLYYQTSTPMVRLNFDPTLSIEEATEYADLNVSPNPFTNETAINFTLKANAEVSVVITDIAGREVMNIPTTTMTAGTQSIAIDGSAFVAGVYNYTLKVGNNVTTKRIVKK